jgi:hypothetical protein
MIATAEIKPVSKVAKNSISSVLTICLRENSSPFGSNSLGIIITCCVAYVLSFDIFIIFLH